MLKTSVNKLLRKVAALPPSRQVLAALPLETSMPASSDQPFALQQRRWNKRFQAQKLDKLWEEYTTKQNYLETPEGGVSLQVDTKLDVDDIVPSEEELVAFGDFELQPFLDLIPYPEVYYVESGGKQLMNPERKKEFIEQISQLDDRFDNSNQPSRQMSDLVRTSGAQKIEQRNYLTRNRHVKRTKAKRALKRTQKFNADQRAIRRLLWLIDRRREYEKHFDTLEDDVDDPYSGEEFWMDWQRKLEENDHVQSYDSDIMEVRR